MVSNFSDGVFAVIITIMAVQFKPPQLATFDALLSLWPTALSYVVSYYGLLRLARLSALRTTRDWD